MADGSVSRIDYVITNQTVTQATVTDRRGNKTIQRFNAGMHPIETVDALGQRTRVTRDFSTNQVMEVRDPLNRLTKFTYDANGNVTSVIDPQSNPTLFKYEPTFNQVTKITDALNQITRFTYDPVTGNLLTTTDPLTHTTTITKDRGQFLTLHSRRAINGERVKTQELTPDSGRSMGAVNAYDWALRTTIY